MFARRGPGRVGHGVGPAELPGTLERIVVRACAILPSKPDSSVVAFPPRPWRRQGSPIGQSRAGCAAAIAFASWLGFAMGSDASRALSGPVPSSDASFLPELFDPGSGFLRDLGEGLRT